MYTGRTDRPAPAAIAVEGERILGVLPWDCEKIDGNWEIHDYGDRMVMPSFIDAHTHLFSGAVSSSEYVCTDLGRGRSQEECVEIIRAFAEEHPDAVNAFLDSYKESVDYVNANVADAAALIEKYDIVTAAVAQKAIPYCNIVFIEGSEMQEKLSGYLNVLYEQNPASVGGALPADDFYYIR